MKCTNCGAAVPGGSSVCPECGVFAGDRPPSPARSERRAASRWIAAIVFIAAGAAGGWWWYTRYGQLPPPDSGPVHVVRGRPGGNADEAEAVRALRRDLVMQRGLVKSDCLAVISRGVRDGYYRFDAVNSCDRTALGRWRVNRTTHAVSR